MLKTLKYLLLLVTLSGCFSLKSNYPPIEYYRLTQEPVTLKNIAKMNVVLMVREMTASGEIDPEHLLATGNNNKIQQYYYNRWITDCSSLVTDFIINRLNAYNAFGVAVVSSSSFVVPDYILEGQIVELMAYNSESNEKDANYVNISLQINVINRVPLKIDNKVVYSKMYNAKVPRPDNSVKSIVPAFNKGLSQITDKMLVDIQGAIARDQMYKNEQ